MPSLRSPIWPHKSWSRPTYPLQTYIGPQYLSCRHELAGVTCLDLGLLTDQPGDMPGLGLSRERYENVSSQVYQTSCLMIHACFLIQRRPFGFEPMQPSQNLYASPYELFEQYFLLIKKLAVSIYQLIYKSCQTELLKILSFVWFQAKVYQANSNLSMALLQPTAKVGSTSGRHFGRH